ncbi:MAG TPA: LuxR family transcriptional regulator, partial [Thiomicrospira sp.]|nr:LuxR family transcriptional regulator [Thiomicrospira sp.]
KHWSTLKLEFSLEELAVNTNTTFKNVFRTDFLVGSWFLEAQGVTHYFGFSPQAEHTSFSAEQLKQLNSLIPHLMESFRLHCLAKHRLSLNSPNFYFGIFQNSGRSIEVDKEFAPLVANYKTSLVKLVKAMKAGEIRFVHLKEQEISFFLRLEAVLDVVFCQAISLPIELEVLTNKELEVCFHLKQMLGNQQIAENMAISPKTVENHLANIYEKLDGVSRSGLIVKLLKQ